MIRSFFRILFFTIVIVGLLAALAGGGIGYYYYVRMTRDLPQIESLKDYRPKAVTSIYAADGTLIAEAYEEKRYPVELNAIPKIVRNAFLAAEDANFYKHPGIDFTSILRAVYVNFRRKATKQGASTITQQVVKSLLLTRAKTMERKIKEAILAYRLEKYLSKDEIFSIYLNEIFLGSGSYGIRAASKVHFRKELSDLSLSEAAFLAGLPQRPSELSRPENRREAINRQHYVLDQMLKNQMITPAEHQEALDHPPEIFPAVERTIFAAPYFASHVINSTFKQVFPKIDQYITATDPGGFKVYTTVDLNATEIAERAVQEGLRALDKRQGWRGPLDRMDAREAANFLELQGIKSESDLQAKQIYKAVVSKVGAEGKAVLVQIGELSFPVNLHKATWARRLRKGDRVTAVDPGRLLKPGDVIEVSIEEAKPDDKKAQESTQPIALQLDQTPEVEGAFCAADAGTGAVVAMVGGYEFQRSQFNRVTLARRQPGSSFKPFVYLAALERLRYTPSTIVPDSPISLVAGDGKLWTPGNFDGKFLGPITLRTALQKSRNVVSVYLIQRVGMERVIEAAKRLGITTPIPPNLSISLGSAEVEMLELVRSYGPYANGGWLPDPIFIRAIEDRDGNIIYEQHPRQRRVMEEDDAFLMAQMLRGVVDRGTATVLRALGRPVAGKTGTTNDHMDAWFIGFTPQWVAGAWVGFDQKKNLGKTETGGKVAAPIFLQFMQNFLKDDPVQDFMIPDGVIPVPVSLETGHLVPASAPGAFLEWFKSGTEPRMSAQEVQLPQDYLSSDEF